MPFWFASLAIFAAAAIGVHAARESWSGRLPPGLTAFLVGTAVFAGASVIFDALAWLIGWTR